MNNTLPEDRVMKAFAIVGLVVLVIVLAWIAVQVIQFIPRGFSSLASLADSVYNNDKEPASLEVTASEDTQTSNNGITISWTDLKIDGTYAFSYECADGVTATIKINDSEFVPVTCDTPFTFGNETYNTEVVFLSTTQPVVDVTYTITFTPDDSELDVRQITRMITITSDAIVPEEPEETPEPEAPVVEETPNEEPAAPVVRYRTVETPIYALPQSDPNGYTELKVTFLEFGTVNSNNVFIPSKKIESGDRGAVRFEVKNIGTKTSTAWGYRATLPFEQRYDAPSQEPLKPNETATITLVFDTFDDGVEEVDVRISGGNDKSTGNNSFSWAVIITD